QVRRDAAVDAADQLFKIVHSIGRTAEERHRGHGAFHNVDLQQKQKEQNHHRGKAKQSPEDLACERFAERIADQGPGRAHFSTVFTNTSSSVLVVGTTASISHFSARNKSTAS